MQKRDMQYTIIGGTLIDAVRNKEFIPWDDADESMLIKEYKNFCIIVGEELDKSRF